MLNFDLLVYIDLTHTITSDIPHWENRCAYQQKIELDYANCSTDVKFRVQSIQMSAGIGTHMDAPRHCFS